MQRQLSTILLAAALVASAVMVQGQFNSARAQEKKTYPKADWVDTNKTAPEGTKYQTFTSKTLGADVSYIVYLPPDYEKETKRYPVIYWLHGLGGNQRAGASTFAPHVDAAIRKGTLPPCIVVSVNGMVTSFYCDWADGKRPIESIIVRDLIPHIDMTYRTIARREGRVIEGYSMGGFGAAHLGFKYPELFGTVCVDAGALITKMNGPALADIYKSAFAENQDRLMAEHPTTLVEKNADKIRGKTNIRIGVGSKDNLLPLNKQLHELLDKLKIENQYVIVPDVGHNGVEYYKKLDNCLEIHRKAFEALGKDK